MRHVGGKGFNRIDAVAQRPGHIGKRARQLADLVIARGQARDNDIAGAPLANAQRRFGKAAQRANNRAAEEE